MSVKESEELAALPERIDALERDRERLHERLAAPDVIRDRDAIAAVSADLDALQKTIERLTGDWERLETLAAEGKR